MFFVFPYEIENQLLKKLFVSGDYVEQCNLGDFSADTVCVYTDSLGVVGFRDSRLSSCAPGKELVTPASGRLLRVLQGLTGREGRCLLAERRLVFAPSIPLESRHVTGHVPHAWLEAVAQIMGR